MPVPTTASAPFWDGCYRRKLLFQRCDSCAAAVFPPQPYCRHCLGDELHWQESSGIGELVTFSVIHRAQTPAFEVPYAAAVVRLNEGYEIITNIVDSRLDEVEIGQRVAVHFVDIRPDFAIPCFRIVAHQQ
ncbi:Zn-ribbon domain-containing OB-fold protein [uncultured Jatrophihabitans sp.]|uniref:Zn-ribbon domain-containing OB-fold protein n=1 Tax=uncultured Jatrophihabitans sp. TaxID=1610747 RepID=UPI0035CB1607